jgi:hypothetical protein
MVFGLSFYNGETPLIFVEPGAKINSSYYCNCVLENGLLPPTREISGSSDWVLQQDGATAYTARFTLEYHNLKNVTIIEPNMWPPNIPDLNPVDCSIWGVLHQRFYLRRHFTTISLLKEAISWNGNC